MASEEQSWGLAWQSAALNSLEVTFLLVPVTCLSEVVTINM